MKYYNLYIDLEKNSNAYHSVTEILGIKPTKKELKELDTNESNTWWHQIVENETDMPFGFINHFLDLIEPNLNKLAALGIKRSDILIWLVYEYDKQCSMEFNPQEMKRLGECGIAFNIDCFELKEK